MMQLSKTIPSRQVVIEFYAIKKDFSTYCDGWIRVREGMHNPLDTCEWCSKQFEKGDKIALGFRTGHANMILCQACASLGASGEGGKK
jgi:hypothetical protein